MNRPLSKHNQKLRDDAIARAKKIAKLKNGGKTFVEIGDLFGITPQRVRQLYITVTSTKNVE